MKRNNIKLSVSRKLINKLSVRQHNRVMSEIRQSITVQSCSFKTVNNIENNIQHSIHIPNSIVDCSSSSIDINSTNKISSIDIEENELSSSSSYISDVSEKSSLLSINSFEPSFREQLASCFVSNNLTHVQGNSILSVLRTHSCFSSLPKDVRTLINTPRKPAVVSNVESGQYIHL